MDRIISTDRLTRATLLEAMARAHCQCVLGCDPDEPTSTVRPLWQLYVEDMMPLLDAVIATAASLQTLLPVMARVERVAA